MLLKRMPVAALMLLAVGCSSDKPPPSQPVTADVGSADVTSAQASATQPSAGAAAAESSCAGFLEHQVRKLHSREQVDLCSEFGGRPLLVVNTRPGTDGS